MKYKRYGEVSADQSLRKIEDVLSKYKLPMSAHKQVLDYISSIDQSAGIYDVTPFIVEAYGFNIPIPAFNTLVTEYSSLTLDRYYTCLYADESTSYELAGGTITIDVDFWKNFSEEFCLDHIARLYNGDKRLCRTYALKDSKSRFVIIGFDEWTSSQQMRDIAHINEEGFCNYGQMFINTKTGSVIFNHVEDDLNVVSIKVLGSEEVKGERLTRAEFEKRVVETEAYFHDGSFYKSLSETVDLNATRKFYLQISRLCMLEKAIREYKKALDSVKRVRTITGAKKKAKAVASDSSGVKVANVDVHTVHSSYKSLEDMMVHKVYEKKPWQGGHHASPIEHEVSGHERHYKNGKVVWIDGYRRGGKKDKPAVDIKAVSIDLKGDK